MNRKDRTKSTEPASTEVRADIAKGLPPVQEDPLVVRMRRIVIDGTDEPGTRIQ